jgi:hypothetical protein
MPMDLNIILLSPLILINGMQPVFNIYFDSVIYC